MNKFNEKYAVAIIGAQGSGKTTLIKHVKTSIEEARIDFISLY